MKSSTIVDSNGFIRRSTCPMNYIVELFGDRWSLLIIRDIMLNRKDSFNALVSSEEGIARNILSNRLKHLEKVGVIKKARHDIDKRKEVYSLTSKGTSLLPVIQAMADWSFNNEPMTLVHRNTVSVQV